jgi:acetyl esterase/lipase
MIKRAAILTSVLAFLLSAAALAGPGEAQSKQAANVQPLAKQPANSAPARPATNPSPVTDFSETKNYPQAVNFPNGVSMSEIVYSTIKGFRPLTLDLYQPQGKSDPRPVLVFIHGGDWVSGDSRHDSPFGDFPGLLASIAAHG